MEEFPRKRELIHCRGYQHRITRSVFVRNLLPLRQSIERSLCVWCVIVDINFGFFVVVCEDAANEEVRTNVVD